MAEQNNEKTHIVSYVQNLWVWIALLILTFLTVSIAGIDFKKTAVIVALVIATLKGSIVIAYFMHLKFDSKVITIMLLVVILLFSVFIGFTVADFMYR